MKKVKKSSPKPIYPPDYTLLLITFILVAVGTIMIISASSTFAISAHKESLYYLKRHLIMLMVGLFAMLTGMLINYQKLKKVSFGFWIFVLILLVLVFIPAIAHRAGGASRWIDLGFFAFQPSEVAKFSMILLLAHSLANKGEKIKDFVEGLLPLLVVVGLTSVLVLKQPDMGTTIIIVLTSFLMFTFAGAVWWQLLILAAVGARAGLWLAWQSPYQQKRVLAFLDPWKDPLGSGFQIIQSLIAVGSGGLLGMGLGESRQKYSYLPQQFTDFIFAILCEELGFIGAIFVLGLFLIFLIKGLQITIRTNDPFGRVLAFGITVWIVSQALLNMGVVTNLIPTTGIPLPFISFGGTSLIVNLFAVGVLLNISKYTRK